ncbi:hypothetical protein ABB37_06441 [Leptomonas pyrrhocoris]|uniref:IP5PC-F beta-propeller domain-containing protein n=1 Tax=Leptomonas pyrrhocoris TaxID=157538 RepID=A0A0N0VEG3_LEPPY|nr:hypothetical protein ABB37_06441 [Leptomonas pyrrhocoris]KPA78302.1 hypothetical protein ABB37_06441 [Leptomonas pyrrhocoris]|eukprot:XP_015656741.1 hypothetical protein ABB37_06441 [Leptomonas pyrrhocoris]
MRSSTRATTSPGASVSRKSRKSKTPAATTAIPNASTKTPKKGRVLRRSEGGAPTSMRSLSKRDVTAVCDSVSVAGRFDGQSRCSAMSPDATVWTGEADGSIVIRLAPSGMVVSRIEPIGRAAVLTLTSVKSRMWAGYSDGTLRVFDHASRKMLRECTQHTAAVYAMCAADGFVYAAGADWKVYQWEAYDLHFCRMYSGHRNTVRCLATYKDPESSRRYVVSGSDDGTVKVWDAAATVTSVKKTAASSEKEAGCIATLDGQGSGVLSMLVLEDTAELWVGSEDTAIRVWDLFSMTITSVITAHRTPVVSLQRVEETIWSGSKDNAIVITNRFSKDVVHRSAQPPTSSSSPLQRFGNMSIQPVTRTVVYNVWATSADGSWQCWNFAAPEGGAPFTADAPAKYPEGHYLSENRHRASAPTSQRRGNSARAGTVADAPASNSASRYLNGSVKEEEDAELRESVARTRRSVEELLTESAEVSRRSMSAVEDEKQEKAKPAGDEGDDVPIEVVAESILHDRAEQTQKEVEHQQAQLQKATKQAEMMRAQLRELGQDPAAVAAAAAPLTAQKSSATDSPGTAALDGVSAKLAAQKAENAALAAAIGAAKK